MRGWEVAKGQFVPVEDAELEALENYDTSRAIQITRFVPVTEVDPVFFGRTYYLVPAAAEAQRRSYGLLLEAMREEGVAGLGSFVLAGKEKFCLIRSKGSALALEGHYLSADVRSQAEIDEAIAATTVRADELSLAKEVIAGLEGTIRPRGAPQRLSGQAEGPAEAKLAGREVSELTPHAARHRRS